MIIRQNTTNRHCTDKVKWNVSKHTTATTSHTTFEKHTKTGTDSIGMKLSITNTRTTISFFILGCTIFLLRTLQHLFLYVHVHQQLDQEDVLQSFRTSSSLLPRKQPLIFDSSSDSYSEYSFPTTQRHQNSLPLSSTSAMADNVAAKAMIQQQHLLLLQQSSTKQRTCTSPEKDVPWIFGYPTTTTTTKSCRSSGTIMVRSRTSDHMCGYCPDDFTKDERQRKELKFAEFLHTLSQQLRTLKEKQCSSLLVYGVAFGEQYTHWLTRQQADPGAQSGPYKMDPKQVDELLKLHGPCFITFVLAENLSNVTQSRNEGEGKQYYHSNDGLQLLVPIERNDLPYINMRRNTKIFKLLGPSFIFGSWVSRVIWQDAKLIATTIEKQILPNNYYDYFFNVIHMSSIPHNTNTVCASFMGLPFHKNTMGTSIAKQETLKSVQFAPHCDAIIEASMNRPTVSDDLHSVQYQCSTYYNQTKRISTILAMDGNMSSTLTSSSPPPLSSSSYLDIGLIDSAFIVWDLRSANCQNFIASISCTWFDEIHCYSDRDQLSFPYIFLKMGLQEIPTDVRMNYHNRNNGEQQQQQIVTPETHHRLFAHYTTPSQPIVHITKSSCHWYSNTNLNDCDFTQNDPMAVPSKPTKRYYLPKLLRPPKFLRKFFNYVPPNYKDPVAPIPLPPSPKAYKLAVIVTGSFHRFIFQSSMQRFIQPLSSQGHYVDFYLSLSMKKAPAYRSDQRYMNYLVNDPIFNKYIYQNDDGSVLLDDSLIKARIRMVVQQQLGIAGADLRYMTFQDNYSDMNSDEQVIERRQRAEQMYPSEDPDLRFPVLDIRDKSTMNRTANANRNMLHLFYHIKHIYQQVLSYEEDIRLQYDFVLFLRDDTMWLQNFDFRAMLGNDRNVTSTENLLVRKSTKRELSVTLSNAELFVPSCDARKPSMHAAEINDHVAIVKRIRADIFGNYFDELFRADFDKCAERLDNRIRYGHDSGRSDGDTLPIPLRGCNSEMILQYILQQKNVNTQKVGQGQIPFQRMALVKNPTTSKVHTCYHKYCQSHFDPLISHPGLKKCIDLTF